MRTVASPICFFTGTISSSKSSPSESSTTSGRRAPANPRSRVGMSICAAVRMMVAHRYLTLGALRLDAGCFRCALGRSLCLCFIRACEPLREERSVVLHPADQRRAACPLPGEAEKVET